MIKDSISNRTVVTVYEDYISEKITEEEFLHLMDTEDLKWAPRSEPFREKTTNDCGNWSCYSFMNYTIPMLNWHYLSRYRFLKKSFINRYADKLNWKLLSSYQKLTDHHVKKNLWKLEWYYLKNNTDLNLKDHDVKYYKREYEKEKAEYYDPDEKDRPRDERAHRA